MRFRTVSSAALLVLATALAGCLETTASDVGPAASEPPAEPLTPHYRFVHVTGNFTRETPEDMVGVCGFDSPPQADETNRSIRFPNEAPDAAVLEALVLSIVHDHSLCGTIDSGWTSLASDHDIAVRHLLGFGDVAFDFNGADGEILVDGETLPPGGAIGLSRSGHDSQGRAWSADLTIRDMGTWPDAGILDV